MSKRFFAGLMAVAMLFTASCEHQDLTPNVGGENTVTITVTTPQIATKAYSDGNTATVLQYAVYDAAGNELTDLTVTDGEIHGSTTVNFQLTTGNTYSVIFWAAAENAPYTVDFTEKTMTVDYTNAVSNDESRDAFYAYHTFTVTGAQTETITLKRPFAQLNIGTADYAASTSAGYTPTQSAVIVKNVYNTLDLVSGAVANGVEANFGLADIKKDETFPVAGNEYLAMNYLLVASTKSLVEVEFTYTDGSNAKTRTVGSVPVQRNYRTNLYGKLLTSNVDINVAIEPDYAESDYNIYNVVVDQVSYDDFATAVAKAMELNKPVEFVQDVKLAAGNTITVPAGKTLTLNLNSFTLSGTDTNTTGNFYFIDNRGTLVVNGPGLIGIVAKNERQTSASSVVIANNPGGNLTVQKGIIIEHFGGSYMAYGIDNLTNGRGTSAVTTIKDATVKSTYRAVRQFLNGVEATNELYVEEGAVLEGANKSIFFHDPSKNANTGTLVVDAAAQLKGDVYLFVTAGSEQWPVEVSIADAALVGDSEVLSANVPTGYVVMNKGGVWTVVNGTAVTVDSVEALKEALNDASAGTGERIITISADANIENATIKLPATLNNLTLTAAAGVSLKNTTISAADGNAYRYENLIFDGLTFDNSRILLTGWRNGEEVLKNLTITNCVFKNLDDNTNTAPVHINKDAAEAVENFTFTNNVIDGATGGSKSGVYAQVTGKVLVANNVINNVSFRPYIIQITTDDAIADEFVVTGNTFSGSAQGRAQGLGNNDAGTDDVKIVVSGNIFKDITDAQQICYWNFNPERTTADLSKNYYDIDIEANPSRIYYNAAAASVADLVDMGVYPFYTALNADGTINLNSLKFAE